MLDIYFYEYIPDSLFYDFGAAEKLIVVNQLSSHLEAAVLLRHLYFSSSTGKSYILISINIS